MPNEIIEKLRQISESLIDPDFAVRVFEEGYFAIVIVDDKGIIRLLNKRTETLFGYHRSELYDKPIEVLVPEASQEKHATYRNQYIADPLPRPMGLGLELHGRHKNGTTFDVEIGLNPVVAPQGVFTVATVVTSRMSAGHGGS